MPPDSRPGRGELDLAAPALIERHGRQIMATARRYAATPEDAEDAYQRGLEIMLTKAPTTSEDELVPWLRTVVKHEAFALRRQRERATPTTDDGELGDPPTAEGATHEQAERHDRLHRGAEALGQLKPQEVRALRLKAQGYSYREICRITGWTYTKVNRCLTEGRRAFLDRVAGIERGAECERLEPLLSALADGEAGGDELLAVRTHLKTCLACRARLRAFRGAPARIAALAPPTAATEGPLRGALESLAGAVQHKAALLGERFHTAAELAAGQKAAAVAASAAAMAGGGATVEQLRHATPAPPKHARPAKQRSRTAQAPLPPPPRPPPKPVEEPPAPAPAPSPTPAATPSATAAPVPAEFTPETAPEVVESPGAAPGTGSAEFGP